MRILHTSDWHLGHMIYGYDRTEEQAAMLEAMCGIASEYKPDLFVLSGDVFHVSQPSAAVQTMFTNAVSAGDNDILIGQDRLYIFERKI